eukprot:5696035-Amphidinium_carterae.2
MLLDLELASWAARSEGLIKRAKVGLHTFTSRFPPCDWAVRVGGLWRDILAGWFHAKEEALLRVGDGQSLSWSVLFPACGFSNSIIASG